MGGPIQRRMHTLLLAAPLMAAAMPSRADSSVAVQKSGRAALGRPSSYVSVTFDQASHVVSAPRSARVLVYARADRCALPSSALLTVAAGGAALLLFGDIRLVFVRGQLTVVIGIGLRKDLAEASIDL